MSENEIKAQDVEPADKTIIAQAQMADGSMVKVYAAERVGGDENLSIAAGQIAIRGQAVPTGQIARGWIDADEYR